MDALHYHLQFERWVGVWAVWGLPEFWDTEFKLTVIPKMFVQAQMAACYENSAGVTQPDWRTWLHMKGPRASPWLVRRQLIMSRLGEWDELAKAGGVATLPACWHLLYKHVFCCNMVSKSVLTFKETSVCKSRSDSLGGSRQGACGDHLGTSFD